MYALHNPEELFNQVKGENYKNKAGICLNLFGRIYELPVGTTKNFPIIKIKGKETDLGAMILKRYPFLKKTEIKEEDQKADTGTEVVETKEDEKTVHPLAHIPGFGPMTLTRLTQAGIVNIEDFEEAKKDREKLEDIVSPLIAKRYIYKD